MPIFFKAGDETFLDLVSVYSFLDKFSHTGARGAKVVEDCVAHQKRRVRH